MGDTAGLLSVGYVARAHGVRGDVIVVLTTDREQRVAPGTVLHGESPNFTERLELVVGSSRPHQDRWIVTFDSWATREAAESLRGTELFAEPIDDPDVVWVHDVVGKALVDQSGTEHGTIVAVEANPSSDLMVLDSGGLVPMVFIESVGPGTVTVEIPEGLLPDGGAGAGA